MAAPLAVPTALATIRAALNKIADHAHSRKYVKLRLGCKELLDELPTLLATPDPEPPKDESWAAESSAPPASSPDAAVGNDKAVEKQAPVDRGMPTAAAAKVMAVFRTAIATKRPNIACEVLDCLQRLVAHRHLRGTVSVLDKPGNGAAPSEPGANSKEDDMQGGLGENWDALAPQAQAVLLMCKSEDIADDGVELRVLKAVLTATTSTTLSIHGQALLLAVRACYNVFIMSRSETNQTTAKASLTQMLNVCFRRMEADTMDVEVKPIVVTDLTGIAHGAGTTDAQTFLNMVVHQTFGPDAAATARARSAINPNDTDTDGAFDEPSAPATEATEDKAENADDKPAEAEADSKDDADAATQDGAEATKTAEADTPVVEAVTDTGGGEGTDGAELAAAPAAKKGKMAVLQKDAYLVFRALCKLSYRSGDSALEPAAGRGKILALELLKILLENAGPAFHGSDKFVGLIRQHLCLSLLKNCTGSVPQALQLSCSIFLTLLSKFRAHLKGEIGVFFPMILLKALEPPPGGAVAAPGDAGFISYDYKRVVLHCLSQQCDNAQLLIDLFVNYDCDLEGPNIFERMVLGLVRVARGTTAPADANSTALAQEANLRVQALGCLVLILQSMVSFFKSASTDLDGIDAGDADAATESARAALSAAEGAVAEGGGAIVRPSSTNSMTAASDAQSAVTQSAAGASSALDDGSEANGTAGGSKMGASARGGADALDSQRAFKKKFQEGIALFNEKPKKGVAFLQDEGLLGREPIDVARFLARTEGLEKEEIGQYLGERDDVCIKVMHAYTDDIPFKGMAFDAALRRFLEGFRLPGEAQKIDRFMEKFADAYYKCEPGPFKNADACYTLAFSTIMLNTDLHNPTIKNKMTLAGFIKNNKEINDGTDLPADFLEELFDAIATNEIKMKGENLLDSTAHAAAHNKQAETLFSTLLSLIPGRKTTEANEPSEEAIRRTQQHLKEKAKGAQFFVSRDAETVRPMIEVAWAPMTGAFSVLFETHDELETVEPCLQGYVAAIVLTSQLGMHMLRGSFMNGLAKFTSMHNPGGMKAKHAQAFKALLDVADQCGNQLHDTWPTVLRCVSKLEHLHQLYSGAPTDASLFAPSSESGAHKVQGVADRLRARLGLTMGKSAGGSGGGTVPPVPGMPPGAVPPPVGAGPPPAVSGAHPPAPPSVSDDGTAPARGAGAPGAGDAAPSAEVLALVDAQDLNRMFVVSDRLDSDAIVEFVRALCEVSNEELRLVNSPRVFSLTKIVEIAHFNMSRIRLVWSRIWAVLSDYFIEVGCHANLSVAMYAVDSLRQLSMKFLERDELSNFTFQNDFLRPFVVVMRQSNAVEIRELIIRCVSQMVLARVANVKSGWKSMFMVFTTAASDEQPTIVRLAFDTIEKIVREHFNHITETETTTFTDAVNCLIAFTNNPHSLDVALNAIAFLRFCAMKLAEGAIGDVEREGVPAGRAVAGTTRIAPREAGTAADEGEHAEANSATVEEAEEAGEAAGAASKASSAKLERTSTMRFTDKEEHVYFWFPLLAGLSELTFDPRRDIRYGALEVLFDTLKYHGAAFSLEFWSRILDSVLLPIFDHVRAEFTDTTTFTDEKKRAEEDSWLYETSTQCLQHLVDIFVQFYPVIHSLLPRLLELLAKFMRRSHQSLASVGVAALVRLIANGGAAMDEAMWLEVIAVIADVAEKCRPDIVGLLAVPSVPESDSPSTPLSPPTHGTWPPTAAPAPSLRTGLGARRLNEVRCHAAIQLLLVQASGELYAQHCRRLTAASASLLLNALRGIAAHARSIDANLTLRRRLAIRQAEDDVNEEKQLSDPPMLRLEGEASHAYLSILLHIHHMPAGDEDLRETCALEDRLVELCIANLERFEATGETAHTAAAAAEPTAAPPAEGANDEGTRTSVEGAEGQPAETQVVGMTSAGVPVTMASVSAEHNAHAPLVVATLRALASFEPAAFKRHLPTLFPLLTKLIRCEGAPPEVQRALSELFDKRVGPLLA